MTLDTGPRPGRHEANATTGEAWSSAQDTVLAAGFGLSGALLTWVLYSRLTFTITHLDVWFDSDSVFVFEVLTSRWSRHNTGHHPLFALLTFPVVHALRLFVGLSDVQAAFVVLLVTSTSFVVSIYVALRLLGRPRAVAVLFTGVFLASTPSILYLGVHDRLILGGLSIVVCIIVFTLVERRRLPASALVIAAAGTLGITITNFVIGMVALWTTLGFRRGTRGVINAFFVVSLLAAPALLLFPLMTAVSTWLARLPATRRHRGGEKVTSRGHPAPRWHPGRSVRHLAD